MTGNGNAVVQTGGDHHGDITVVHHEAPAPPRTAVITSLPPMPRVFHGRDRELQQILDAADRHEQVVAIHAIDGMAGVGKTTLAVRAAHLLADRYPDGRFFIELHAHTAGQTPADPFDVLGGLLIELGTDPRTMPDTMTGRRDLWRHVLADKRALVVLDDAANRHQVQPLLPSGAQCLTLITSRHRLLLAATRPLSLDVLAPEPATDLFLALTHRDPHAPGERDAAAQMAAVCGGLPLAIGLVAGQIAHHSRWTATDISTRASELSAATDRLAAVDRPDDPVVRAAFDMSYSGLPPARQVLFHRLGLHPGSDLDVYAAAALAGVDRTMAAAELEALYTDHLIDETARGRYRLHDLLRDYARTLTTSSTADTDHAINRLLNYYQSTATIANQILDSGTSRVGDGTIVEPMFEDRVQALRWLRVERVNLMACLDHAANHDLTRLVTFTRTVARRVELEGPWPLAVRMHQRAVAAAQQLGDRLGEAGALRGLGDVRLLTGNYPAATDLYQQALTIYRDLRDRLGEAHTLGGLGNARQRTSDYVAAIDFYHQVLAIYRDLGHRHGEATTLDGLGNARQRIGDYQAAVGLYQQALAMFRDLGDRLGEAHTLGGLGNARQLTTDYLAATDLYEQALTIYRDLGDRQGEATTLDNLGRCHEATGDCPAAIDLYQQALAIFRDLGDRLGEATALDDLGDARQRTGDYPAAADLFHQALAIFRDLGDRHGQATALHNLGDAHRLTSNYLVAADLYQQALDIYRDIGDRQREAVIVAKLEVVRVAAPTVE
ncbi:ATP-binding protein [Nocardia sp. alder85J]|uniref:ATP-binding protein n=1 Tax=Nocardia sp. alder85J TaxID=2862949 RepID=UPI001CD1F4DC|nr:tetratricopeptide repeat protein [Nocardia sp. alder85J]MCX4097715.1 tetratricopeptide repeat protein [Nocardia sp. alder85J]